MTSDGGHPDKGASLRERLERNKVFFETIVIAWLAFMSLLIAGATALILWRQTDIIDRQTNLIRLQSLPQS